MRLHWLALGIALLSGCSASLRLVPHGAASADSPVRALAVTTPPPPARIENVPSDPGGTCAWLDGQWMWLGQHWEWLPGDWVVAPAGCHYADPVMTWLETASGPGMLYYSPGAWYPDSAASDASGRRCGLAQSCLAATGRSE